ncbi:glutamate-cysteine ligase family protein, partial [Nocardioides kribbensis]
MTTHTSHLAPPEPSLQTLADADVLSGRDAVAAAAAYVAAQALADGPVGRVGLELELHLVDLARPAERVAWADVMALVAAMPAMPSGSSVTLEPGGQLELSTPPHADV